MHGSRGCFGCCSKPPLVISVDEPSNGLKIQGQRVKKKHSLTEDFWSPTSGDIDNSTFPSHRSISSISTSNQTHDTLSNADGTSSTSKFVNHGLLLWNQTRQQWVGVKGSQKTEQVREPKLSWNVTYDSLLGTDKPFPQPIHCRHAGCIYMGPTVDFQCCVNTGMMNIIVQPTVNTGKAFKHLVLSFRRLGKLI